jgi:adenosine kinase
MEIFISGSLAYDRIMDFPGKFADHILPDKIHILNVCFMVNGLTEKFGGTAGNIAYSLALLGEKPLILATAGKDFGRYREWLEHHNIPLHGIRLIPEEFTAGAYITTDQSDNQITGFNPGAMKYRSLFSFDNLDPAQTIAIVAPGNLDDMLIYCQSYREKNIPYIFDPGQSIPMWSGERLVEMLTGASITISNDYELEMIMKKTDLSKSEIIERTSVLITTLGENGSLIQNREGERHIAAVPAPRVADPTGAGDGFRAGLIKGLILGKGLVEAAQIGSVCASYTVECYGTQEHVFTQEEFWSRYQENFEADKELLANRQ